MCQIFYQSQGMDPARAQNMALKLLITNKRTYWLDFECWELRIYVWPKQIASVTQLALLIPQRCRWQVPTASLRWPLLPCWQGNRGHARKNRYLINITRCCASDLPIFCFIIPQSAVSGHPVLEISLLLFHMDFNGFDFQHPRTAISGSDKGEILKSNSSQIPKYISRNIFSLCLHFYLNCCAWCWEDHKTFQSLHFCRICITSRFWF